MTSQPGRGRAADGRQRAVMLVGVFFTFAPVGFLGQMVMDPPGAWAISLVHAAVSGIIGTAWAWVFLARRYWLLVPLVLAQVGGPALLFRWLYRAGMAEVGSTVPATERRVFLAVLSVLCIVAGYALVIYYTRRRERQISRAMAELELAAQLHTTLVPPLTLRVGGLEVLGRSRPSSEMGGDLVDAVRCGSRTDLVLADVSGHGVRAGVVMGMLKSALRARLLGTEGLARLVGDVNRVLADLTDPDMFATFVALRFDAGERMEFALAGHLPIHHFQAASNRWIQHPNDNLPLGISSDHAFSSGESAIAAGDLLVAYTDGFTEVQNGQGRMLGLSGVAELLNGAESEPLDSIARRLFDAADRYGPQNDDQSVLLVRIHTDDACADAG